MEYEDKGLSSYYSDRPDFQRMLHDIRPYRQKDKRPAAAYGFS